MSTKKYIYVNPLGEIQDISYNNVVNLKNNAKTTEAKIDDSEKRNKSNHMQLALWSFTSIVVILILLVLIRNI
jgi:hypothetical protein